MSKKITKSKLNEVIRREIQKAAKKQTSLQRQTQESVEIEEAAGTQAPGVEILGTLMKLAQEETYGNREVEGHLQFKDGRTLRVNSDVAKRMVATFEALDAQRQDQYRFLMNKSVEYYKNQFKSYTQYSTLEMFVNTETWKLQFKLAEQRLAQCKNINLKPGYYRMALWLAGKPGNSIDLLEYNVKVIYNFINT